jgi:hypothetical protein
MAYAQDRRIVLNQATAELVMMLLAAEASKALHHVEPPGEALQIRGLRTLPVYQW